MDSPLPTVCISGRGIVNGGTPIFGDANPVVAAAVPEDPPAKGEATKKPGAVTCVCEEGKGVEFWCIRVGESGW